MILLKLFFRLLFVSNNKHKNLKFSVQAYFNLIKNEENLRELSQSQERF